jgi:hypothetical protein
MKISSLVTIIVVVIILVGAALVERRDARMFNERLERAKIEFNEKQLAESVKFRNQEAERAAAKK